MPRGLPLATHLPFVATPPPVPPSFLHPSQPAFWSYSGRPLVSSFHFLSSPPLAWELLAPLPPLLVLPCSADRLLRHWLLPLRRRDRLLPGLLLVLLHLGPRPLTPAGSLVIPLRL